MFPENPYLRFHIQTRNISSMSPAKKDSAKGKRRVRTFFPGVRTCELEIFSISDEHTFLLKNGAIGFYTAPRTEWGRFNLSANQVAQAQETSARFNSWELTDCRIDWMTLSSLCSDVTKRLSRDFISNNRDNCFFVSWYSF